MIGPHRIFPVFTRLFSFCTLGCVATLTVAAETTLTLDEAIHLALQHNQQIKVQSFAQPIARANLLAALGQFDPSLNFGRSYSEDGTPYSADPLVKQLVQTDSYSVSIQGLSPWGLTYNIGANAENQRSTIATTTFPQGFLSFAGISVTQPLLRGFGFGPNLVGVRVAKANRAIADWQFRQTLIDTVTNVIGAYSDLALAQEELRIAQRSHDAAAGLLHENEKRFKVGSMSESDVTQARARVAARDEAIVLGEQAVHDSINQLRELIGETSFPIQPDPLGIDSPDTPDTVVNPAADLKIAYDLRPDYQAARLGLVRSRANDSAARNQLLPQVNFVGSYGYVGLDQSFAASRQMVADQENRSYSAGLVVSVPFTFAQGRGNARAARLQLHQAEADLTRLEQDIAVAVAHAAGEIDTTRRRVAADRTAYDLAKQALDAELKKLRAGTSNTFFVLNLQDQLAGAEFNYYAALADQRRAHAAYDHELGRTLVVRHIALDKE